MREEHPNPAQKRAHCLATSRPCGAFAAFAVLHLRKNPRRCAFPLHATTALEPVVTQVRQNFRTCGGWATLTLLFLRLVARTCGWPSAGAIMTATGSFSCCSQFPTWSEPRPIATRGPRGQTYQQVWNHKTDSLKLSECQKQHKSKNRTTIQA